MKNLLKSTLSCIILSSMASCSMDGPEIMSEESELIPFHFTLNFSCLSGTDTRSLSPDYSFSDGSSISILKGYVYNKANGSNSSPIKVVDIDIKEIDDKRGGDITIMLPKNQMFDIVFLGTSIEQSNPSSKLFFNSSDRTLTVNYGKCNDEEMDCFYASRSGVTSNNVESEPIELTRPFAQLNIGTQDYDEYNSTTPVKDISVSVSGIYDKIDLMTGNVIGDPISVNFLADPIPSGQVFPVSGFSYLSMNYLLVGTRKLIDLEVAVNHTNSSVPVKTINIENLAVECYYQKNVYGNTLLT